MSAIASSGHALAASTPKTSPSEIEELRAELRAIKAADEAADAQKLARQHQIDALQRRLDAVAGIPPESPANPVEAPPAPTATKAKPSDGSNFEIYGFAQLDYIQDFNRVDPNWADTLRPSKIPTTKGVFGSNGKSILSVKQSKLGFQGSQMVAGQPLTFKFDFDIFGVGADAGQTTIRIRNAYGQWGPLLAGQTNSLFMDGDIFPNTIDYWGPAGMVFLRLPQVRLTLLDDGESNLAIAIEKPGNDIDPGQLREIAPGDVANLQAHDELPDFTARYQLSGSWGHVQLAGIARDLGFETKGVLGNNPKGHTFGWGIDATTVLKTWDKDRIKFGVVYGEGIASYMNDGGTDLAPHGVPGSLVAKAVPLLGLSIYYDHYWSDMFSTSLGWSQTQVENTSFQQDNAFKTGQYASVNLLFTPAPRVTFGAEFLYGSREDKSGASGNDYRMQFSANYSFSSKDFF